MLKAVYENRFKKEVEKAKKRGKDCEKLQALITMLVEEIPLPPKNKNHKLQGEYQGYWECHIEPDWLLVYKKTKTEIYFARTGSHSDLF